MSNEKLINNITKALLYGFIVGLLIGFTGKYWDFTVHWKFIGYGKWVRQPFASYGTTQAIIGGILAFLFLLLKYNKK